MKFKNGLFFLITFLSFFYGNAQSPMLEWGLHLACNTNAYISDIESDEEGNIYLLGEFYDTIDIDLGESEHFLYVVDGESGGAFIQKSDSEGNLIWVKQIGGEKTDLNDITISEDGYLYIAGRYWVNLDYDSETVASSLGGNSWDAFAQKIDLDGNHLWTKQVTGYFTEVMEYVACDSNNDLIIVGTYSGTVDFDPGEETYTQTGSSRNVFVEKLDADGNFIWVKQIEGLSLGSNVQTFANANLDHEDNIYVLAEFDGEVDVDPGPGLVELVKDGVSGFSSTHYVVKLDTDGYYQWNAELESGHTFSCNGLTTDPLGNVLITGGFFIDDVDFDPGEESYTVTNPDNVLTEIYVLKLDNNGAFDWVKVMQGSSTVDFEGGGFDAGDNIFTDQFSNIYVTGYFDSTVDFDPGEGEHLLTQTNGTHDAYLQKLRPNGELSWVKQFSGSSSSMLVHFTSSEDILLVSQFVSEVSVDILGSNSVNFESNGMFDAYVLKFDGCQTSSIDMQSSCDSYSWIDGNTYYESNQIASVVFTNSVGCDSIVTLDLTIYNSSGSIDTHVACESFVWIDGNTYTEDNNSAIVVLTNAIGCDSLITLDLTIDQPDFTADVIASCEPYLWIDGNTYEDDNNSAIYVLTNQNGCDSTVTLQLSIVEVPDASVTVSGNTITANTSSLQYQWYHCDEELELISGKTEASFTATENGNYLVRVQNEACFEDSECISINSVGLDEYPASAISIYPNPNNGEYFIDLRHTSVDQMVLMDLSGKQVWKIDHPEQKLYPIKTDAGVYLLYLLKDDQVLYKKIMSFDGAK